MYDQTVMEGKTKEDKLPVTFKEQAPAKVKI